MKTNGKAPSRQLRQELPLVQCPFYRYDNGSDRVVCEGVAEGSSLALVFERKADMIRQKEVFCCEHFRKCEVYAMLMKKYDMEA